MVARGFQLVQNAVAQQHQVLRTWLRPGDVVVDATCGNGHDTLFLWDCVQPQGRVFSYDIQPAAIASARQRLQESHAQHGVTFVEASHADFQTVNALNLPVRAVVYNLGYLPGGDHAITTNAETTIASVQAALNLVAAHLDGGVVSIVSYVGHDEGAEDAALEHYVSTLPTDQFAVAKHIMLNRAQAPRWYLIEAKVG